MKNYINYLNEKKNIDILSYSIFDWDDNILIMQTLIHYLKKINEEWIDIDITSEDFATIRKNYNNEYDNEDWKADDNSFI